MKQRWREALKIDQNVNELWDNFRKPEMCVTVVPQGETHVYADKYFVSPVPHT